LSAVTADGVSLSLRRFAPAGARRAVCLCTHAMMARGAYLERRFAPYLATRGVEVFVLDWRGHGRSRPPDPRLDRWSFDDYVELDLPAAIGAACDAAGVAPAQLCYVGHSLGGLAGLAAFGTGAAPAPRRLSLWATSVWLPGRRGPRYRRAAMAVYAGLARALGHAPIRRLRLGTDDENPAYVAQLAGWAHSGRFTSLGGADYLAALRRVRVPVWAASGAGDRLCTPADARVLLARLPGAPPLRVVGRAAGDALDADHFTLFSDERLSPLWDEHAAFLTTQSQDDHLRIGPLPRRGRAGVGEPT
jgi:predicted alpha/beta hydrolase